MKKGFTLIEVLISIAIFSLIIALAAYSFRFYAGVVRKIVMPYPEKAVKFSRLGDTIRSIFYFVGERTNILNKEEFFIYFYGKRDSMTFITAEPIDISDNLAVCKLFVDNGTLILKESPVYSRYNNYKNPSLTKRAKKIILMRDISDFKITYFTDGEPAEEVSQRIPQLIEIKLKQKDKSVTLYFKIKSNFNNKKTLTEFSYAPL